MTDEIVKPFSEGTQETPMWKRWINPVGFGALAVFVVTQIVYISTVTITCPFWDSGEFIATSYTLGIPHPPGTPLYVLIGRLFTLFPVAMVATRVNYLSALASTMAAVFTFLVAVRFFQRWPRSYGSASVADAEEREGRTWLAVAVGLVAAFFAAFGRTFWDNAVEAEVYGLSSFVMIFSVWLTLRWADGVESYRRMKKRAAAEGRMSVTHPEMLVLIIYLLFLSIGIHMGTFIVLFGILAFVALVDPQTVFNSRFLMSLAMAGGAIVLFFILMSQGTPFLLSISLAMILYGLVVGLAWKTFGQRNYAFWCFVLGFLGVSVHLFLYIRAGLDPMINEADPSTWEDFWLVLSRDQYKPPPIWERQAPILIQFKKHFWRYANDQYELAFLPRGLALYLPWALGLVGAVGHWVRERKGALFMTVLYLSTSALLILVLNFKENEVRDRDYFFVASYHFFAIWIGLGVGELAMTLREALTGGTRRFMVSFVAILGIVLSLLPVKAMHFEHDRTENWVARDYAYNMLIGLEEDAILFTNGDNDTFPLWYLQEVEGIRRDVRVVNLSLLQTNWYIKQLRDYPPSVDLKLTDEQIDALRPFIDSRTRKVVWVNDLAVARIVELYSGKRPIYIAVTVPDRRELEDRLVMEGLVFAVRGKGERSRIDVEKTLKNLTEVYKYRGLLDEDGYFDESVYKDENSTKLVQNYAAAWVRIAHQSLREGNKERAKMALERAQRISPRFAGASYTMGVMYYQGGSYAESESIFQTLVREGEGDAQVLRLLGMSQEAQGKVREALQSYQAAVNLDPQDRENHLNLVQFLMSMGQPEQALIVVDRWIKVNPNDKLFLDARSIILDTIDSLRKASD